VAMPPRASIGSSHIHGGNVVHKRLAFIVVVCVLSVPATVYLQQAKPATAKPAAPAPAAKPAAAAAPAAPTIDDVLMAVRADLQGSRSDIMAKNMSLTAEQAAKFWPMFEKYQKEQNVIMDEQMRGIQKYADSYQTLDDAGALALMNAHLDRDAKMVALRQRWLGEFQKVLPTKLAARAMQIDRRLSLAHQMEFSARIPLIH
jgi:Spy/CpxP family protein refolding chaperone